MRTRGIRQANWCSLPLSLACEVRRRILFFPCSWAALVCLGIIFPPTEPSCWAQAHVSTCAAQDVFKIVVAELKQKRYDQAELELDRLRGCGGLSSIDTFNLGWLYGRTHNFKKALAEFNSVNQNVPDQKTH